MKYLPLLTAGREADPASRIAALNDAFRTTFTDGMLILSLQLFGAPEDIQQRALDGARAFSDFDHRIDAYGEHSAGFFTDDGLEFFWKIDVYSDADCIAPGDPLDPGAFRVLSLMFVDDCYEGCPAKPT